MFCGDWGLGPHFLYIMASFGISVIYFFILFSFLSLCMLTAGVHYGARGTDLDWVSRILADKHGSRFKYMLSLSFEIVSN